MVGDARCTGQVALDLLGWGAWVIPRGLLLWKSLEAEGKRELSLVQSQSGHFLWDLKCILSPQMSFGVLSRVLSGGKSGTSTLGDLCPLA